ncbi:hypothetical protein J7T55_015278 [Diaporthe amygdali]|uniref:uncharacterized protein n=1 Tax=Phomopsis amygdali TaxID=1214568 RepID=UPI0022FE7F3F|nr:uncharacterized protein J7T55_015278 [Diaporthe amygdali]KAJ0120549.1 hypothetical protein J7T55_015278 [Diaporthe amygdali]
MAPSQPPSASGNFQVYTRPPSAGSVPKLRDSCNACASSKIKCHKQKPTCSGCTRRGLKCEYLTSNRGGRAVRNNQNAGHTRQRSQPPNTNPAEGEDATITVARASTPAGSAGQASTTFFNDLALDPVLTTVSTPATTTSEPGSATVPPSGLSTSSSLSSLHVGYPFTPGGSGSCSTFTGLPTPTNHHEFDLSSLLNDCMTDDPIDFLSDPFLMPLSFDNANFLGGTTPLPTPIQCVDPMQIEDKAPLPQPENDLSRHQDHDKSDCYCLSTALALMKRLSLKPSAATCATFGQAGDPKPSSALSSASCPTIEEVITKNQGAIESIGRMLNCSCARDGYLLALISLVLLKILAWYDASARASPDGRPPAGSEVFSSGSSLGASGTNSTSSSSSIFAASPAPSAASSDHNGGVTASRSSNMEQVRWAPSVVSSYCLDGEDSGRMAAQLVLSELSRVQRLVSGLEETLRALLQAAHNNHSSSHGGAASEGGGLVGAVGGLDRDESATPFPLLMLEGMVANIKKKLKAISIGIVKKLNSD